MESPEKIFEGGFSFEAPNVVGCNGVFTSAVSRSVAPRCCTGSGTLYSAIFLCSSFRLGLARSSGFMITSCCAVTSVHSSLWRRLPFLGS